MTNGTLEYPYEDVGTPISVIIPSVLVPIAVLVLLCCFCYWLNKKSPDVVSAKPHTYQDFSRVDDTTALRMSGELIENAISNDSLNIDDTKQHTECSSGSVSYGMQEKTDNDANDKYTNSSHGEDLNQTDSTDYHNGINKMTLSELKMTTEIS